MKEPQGHQEGLLPQDPNPAKELLGHVQCLPSVHGRPCYGYLAIKYFGKYEYEATLTRRIDVVQEYTRMPSEAAGMYF